MSPEGAGTEGTGSSITFDSRNYGTHPRRSFSLPETAIRSIVLVAGNYDDERKRSNLSPLLLPLVSPYLLARLFNVDRTVATGIIVVVDAAADSTRSYDERGSFSRGEPRTRNEDLKRVESLFIFPPRERRECLAALGFRRWIRRG